MAPAGRGHEARELSDSWYGAAVRVLMFRLSGRHLKLGDSISPIDFQLVVPKALRLPTAYQWDDPKLLRKYGHMTLTARDGEYPFSSLEGTDPSYDLWCAA